MVFKVQKVGGDERNRTADPLLARQVLSQLSYAPTFLLLSAKTCLVGLSGLEPLTSRLSGVRSNQLSYRPFCFSLRAAPSKLNINQRMCVDLKSTRYLTISCLHRKEVIQPHLPIRLPCYDFTPIIGPTLDGWLLIGYLTGFGCYQLSWCDGRCVQGPGTYSPQYADLRLLAIPTSRRRVAACDLNWGCVFELCSPSRVRFSLLTPIVVRV